jgi:hypothetical protein
MSTEIPTKSRYEYGRHETFAVRYGWLGKGLRKMESSPTGFIADEAAVVELGLGSRMVKSLRYWLEASGLGEVLSVGIDGRKIRELHTSPLGKVVLNRDPFMEFPATWWFVHLNLASRSGSVWGWFFNDFRERLFERPTCVEAYMRHLRMDAANEPTLPVAQRDIACLLAAYGTASANEPRDPEDGTASPLRDLGLILRHEDIGRFEKTRPLDEIPIETFLACVAVQSEALRIEALSMGELVGRRGGPGLLLGITTEAIEDLSARGAKDFGKLGVTLDLLGAERRLHVPKKAGMQFWLDRHFQRVKGGA